MSNMTQEEILKVVKKHLVDICADVDASKDVREASMKDLGASSLDIVEIVSCSMRELRVRVPRSELSKLTNIGGLVDVLHKATMEQAQA